MQNVWFISVLQPIKAEQIHSCLWEMKENAHSLGDVCHAFIHGWASNTCCKLRV